MSGLTLGVDRQDEILKLTKDKKIALATNFTGVDSNFNANYNILIKNGCNVVKLMTPEHGLYGAADGEAVGNSVHRETGLPIISMYGDNKQPQAQDLLDIDTVIYDIQDVGLRYFTYIYTLAYILKACAKHKKQVIVLDRPNPLGCETITGCRIDEQYSSFVGDHGLTLRYGMTPGEVGRYFIDYLKLDVEYDVVTMQNYKRQDRFLSFGSPWNVPSPAIPDYDALLCYIGGCFFETTNLSEGRGTPRPFRFYGAPYIKPDKLLKELNLVLPKNNGFAFRGRSYTPFSSKHINTPCHGVEFFPQGDKGNFLPVAVELMRTVKKLYPEDFSYIKYADVSRLTSLSGDERITKYVDGELESLDEMYFDWSVQQSEFRQQTQKHYLY